MKTKGTVHIMNRCFRLFVVVAAVIVMAAVGVFAAADEPITVAVMEFDVAAGVRNQWSGVDVGRQVTALVTDQLANAKGFNLVERDLIDQILSEQNLGASDRIDPSRAPEIGRLLGADALVFGSVTKFEFSSTGGLSFGGFSLGGTSASVDFSGRIVDTTQGVILGSVGGHGSHTGLGISVKDVQGISFHASQFQESAIGKATTNAVGDFVAEMSSVIKNNEDQIRSAKERGSLRGVIIALIDGGAVVNIGQNDGVRLNQRFAINRMMEISGLSEPVRIPVGTMKVISVDPAASVALFENVSQDPQVGDVVSPD